MAEKSAAHEVHLDRLFSARRPRWLVRVAATVVCHAIVAMFRAVAGLLEPVRAARRVVDTGGSRCRGGRACRPARIVLTGTFAADNWLRAHVLPVAATEQCARVFVVSDRPFLPMRKVTYVCPPRWLVRVVGRTPARSVWFVLTCLLRKPDVVGGFHLLFNGLVALVTAPVVGARAAYFCVGGWAEVIQGGVHGGNKLFNRIGRDDPVLEGALLALVKRFDLILTMGTGARDFFRARGVSCRIEVMSGGIDDRLYAPDGSGTRYDIVTVSRIVPVKRMDVFLDVVRKVAEACPEVRVAVVGDGEALAAARRHAEAIGVADRVVFAGRQGDVGPWLARSRVFLLTSDSEGLSLALMEAGMAGLPAVVSDVGDLGDLVADGVNGWLIPPGAVDRFAERVTALLCDDALYARCASAARERALAHSVSSATRRWMDVLSAMGVARGMVDRDGAAVPETAWRVPSRRALWRASKRIMGSRYVAPVSLLPPQVWLGREFRRALRRVEAAQFWSRDEATAYQLRALQRIVSLAYDGSVYYRESLGGVGFEPGDLRTPADLSSLPMIDADVVRAHGRDMCTVASVDEVADYVSTGGTGGKPLHFYINRDRSAVEYAHLAAAWRRVGYRLRMPMAVFRGRVVAENGRGIRHEIDPFLRHHFYSAFHMSDEQMDRYVRHIGLLGTCFIHAYPSTAAALARFVRRSGVGAPGNVRGVIVESEIVYPDQRRLIEEVFGCRVLSCYGHTEKLVSAAGCETSNDYHVWPTYGYVELVDDGGAPITVVGQRGEIVATGFINTVMPFIRYRTGDFATLVGMGCSACGRHQMLLGDIRGHRIQEVLLASDGSAISWTALNMHDDTFVNVRQFQFRQDVPGEAVLRCVPAHGFGDADRRRIQQRLDEKLGGRVRVRLETVSSLPLPKSGKAVYVDSHVPDAMRDSVRRPAEAVLV